ncbi:MAG: DegV family protein [Acholeplasmataceae bacterium]|nr:DegV family protein [Acholeplasmataceae bacterium]
MRRLILCTDSCSDLSAKQVDSMGIHVIPLSLEMRGETFNHYPDERELAVDAFYDALRQKAVATTSLINTAQFIEFFESFLKESADILYIGFSSALSGTYQSSRLAADELRSKYPEATIITIDSLSASAGLGLLVKKAWHKIQEGKTIDEVAAYVESIKLNLAQLFTVAELGTLKRGGRLSNSAAFVGTLLKVKPILHVSDEGKLVPLVKVRGRKSSLDKMVDLIEERFDGPDQTIIIAHGDCPDEAKEVGHLIKTRTGVKDIIYNTIGPIIGAHSGPDTIAVFFMGKHR